MDKHYVDGFLLPVPKDKLPAYRKLASKAAKIWLEHGALDYRECVGDDLDVKDVLSLKKAAKSKPEEVTIFAYIVFKSRKDRDRVNAAVMNDPRIAAMGTREDMPFDCKRLFYGGFKTIVAGSAKAE